MNKMTTRKLCVCFRLQIAMEIEGTVHTVRIEDIDGVPTEVDCYRMISDGKEEAFKECRAVVNWLFQHCEAYKNDYVYECLQSTHDWVPEQGWHDGGRRENVTIRLQRDIGLACHIYTNGCLTTRTETGIRVKPRPEHEPDPGELVSLQLENTSLADMQLEHQRENRRLREDGCMDCVVMSA